jgi:hypothetical protein
MENAGLRAEVDLVGPFSLPHQYAEYSTSSTDSTMLRYQRLCIASTTCMRGYKNFVKSQNLEKVTSTSEENVGS